MPSDEIPFQTVAGKRAGGPKRWLDAMGFTAKEAKLYAILEGRKDVPVSEVYERYYDRDPFDAGHFDTRRQMQALSWIVSRLNRKLELFDRRIAPGMTKKTYRIFETA
jgi:hypothetical protein